MKKVYLSALALALGVTGVNAQNIATEFSTLRPLKTEGGNTNQVTQKALGQSVWSDNFDTPANWVIDNDGQSGAEFGWNIDQNNDSWYLTDISSTSGGNYAEVNNGDPTASPATQVLDVEYTMTTATPLDIMALTQTATGTATDQVLLTFEQFGAKFNDLQEVQISTDGSTFTPVFSNSNKETLSTTGGSVYDDPETVFINISDVIAGNATSVYIRFSWTTDFPNSASNPNVWVAYGWMIDDVKITTLNDNDLILNHEGWGSYEQVDDQGNTEFNEIIYYTIPTAQLGQMAFGAGFTNQGVNDLTNVTLDVDVNGTVTSSPAISTLAAGDSDSLTAIVNLPGAGVYTISQSFSYDQTEDTPADNALKVIPNDITVVDGGHIYARDEGQNYGVGGGDYTTAAGATLIGYEAGSYYEINSNATLKGIDVGIANEQGNVGDEIYVAIYLVDATGNFSLAGVSDFYAVDNWALGDIVCINFPGSGVDLTAGELYFAVVGTQSDFEYMTSGFSPGQTSLIFYGNGMNDPATDGNLFTSATPVVRLNFMGTVGTEEEEELGATLAQNAPNPFTSTTEIAFELTEAQDVSFEIRDLSGKLVQSADLGMLNAGSQSFTVDASGLAGGIYTYTMTVGNKSVTKKMIVKK